MYSQYTRAIQQMIFVNQFFSLCSQKNLNFLVDDDESTDPYDIESRIK